MARSYHLGIMFGSFGIKGLHQTADHRSTTAAIYAERCIDNLPCEIHAYWGERETTKKDLRAKSAEMLPWLREKYPDRNITRVVVI